MRVEIRAADADGVPALHEFFRWLRDDEDGPKSVRIETADGRAGAMGALEVIQVVFAESTAVASLAMQYVSWRRSRAGGGRGGAEFTFSRSSDGLSVTVTDGTEDEVRRIMAALAVPPEPAPAPEDRGRTAE